MGHLGQGPGGLVQAGPEPSGRPPAGECGADGHEADDVIGTLCAAERTDPVEVVSGDRDLMQVVRDEPTPVRLVYVGRGLAKAEFLGPPEVAAK